jgi:hypothetical protein
VPPIVPEMGIDQTPMDFRDFHYLKEKLEPTFIKNHAVLVNKINVLEDKIQHRSKIIVFFHSKALQTFHNL